MDIFSKRYIYTCRRWNKSDFNLFTLIILMNKGLLLKIIKRLPHFISQLKNKFYTIFIIFNMHNKNIFKMTFWKNHMMFIGEEGRPDWNFLSKVCLPNATYQRRIETTNLMKVVFRTDSYMNKTGFKASVRIGKYLVFTLHRIYLNFRYLSQPFLQRQCCSFYIKN